MINLRIILIQLLSGFMLLALVAGCDSLETLGSSAAPPTPAVQETLPVAVPASPSAPALTQTPEPTRPPVPTEEPPAVTIDGQVKDIAASARVIHLTEPVQGFNSVALTDRTEFISKDDSVKSLADLKAGMKIEVAGKPGSAGAVLASKIRILATSVPAASAGQWTRVQIPGVNLSFEGPTGWKQQGKEYAWANPKASGQLVGINWMERKGGVEPTSILPKQATSLDAAPIELKWGKGIKYTVEISNSAAGGNAVAVETHVVILTDKFVVDVYASAPSPEDLDSLAFTLQHMLDSAK